MRLLPWVISLAFYHNLSESLNPITQSLKKKGQRRCTSMKRRPFTIRGGGSSAENLVTSNGQNNVGVGAGSLLLEKRAEKSASLPWGRTLAVLTLVYTTNQWCRSLIFYLVSFAPSSTAHSFMNVALKFDQTQYGLLASFAFTSLFAVSALFAGRFADRRDRSQLTSLACLSWGLATVATGLAPSFASVFALRVIQGVSMGFCTPAGFGLLAEAFPESERATANSLYGSAVYLGGGLASLTALLSTRTFLGWRGTCVSVGSVALLASALTAVFVVDPRERATKKKGEQRGREATREQQAQQQTQHEHQLRQERGQQRHAALTTTTTTATAVAVAAVATATATEAEKGAEEKQQEEDDADPSLLAVVRSILRPLPVRLLFAASAMRFCAGFSIGVWLPPLFREAFPERQVSFAVVNAAIVSAGGFASSVTGGKLADWAHARAQRARARERARQGLSEGGGGSSSGGHGGGGGGRAWVVAGSCFAAVPAWLGVVACVRSASAAASNLSSQAAAAAAAGVLSKSSPWLTKYAFEGAMACLLAEYLVAEMWFGPTVSILQSLVPASCRGTAQGLFSILTTFGNIAPVAIGAVVSADIAPLSTALLVSVPAFYALSGLLFAATAVVLQRLEEDL